MPEGDFSVEEKIESLTALTGMSSQLMIVKEETQDNLLESGIPTISEFDPALKICWFIPRRVIRGRQRMIRPYYVLDVVDSNNVITQIRCWGVNPEKDHVQTNRVYIAKLDYNEQWGFSTRSLYHNFRVI